MRFGHFGFAGAVFLASMAACAGPAAGEREAPAAASSPGRAPPAASAAAAPAPSGQGAKALDLDGDGKPDVFVYSEHGKVVRRELVVDGRVRVWLHYVDGVLVRRERDLDGDGKPDAVEELSRAAAPAPAR